MSGKPSQVGRVLRLFRPYRGRLLLGALTFVIKDSPLWVMPAITAWVIDIVARGQPASTLIGPAILGAIVLAQNILTQVLVTRWYTGSVRAIGAELRRMLSERFQLLAFDTYSRLSPAIVQSKLVRDVENIEMMFVFAGLTSFSAVLIVVGALVITAMNAPEFVWVFVVTVPLGAALWTVTRLRAQSRNEAFREEIEAFSTDVGDMATLIPITRSHGLESTAIAGMQHGAERLRAAVLQLDLLNSGFGAATWVAMQLVGLLALVGGAFAAASGWIEIGAGQLVLVSSYFALLIGAVTSALFLLPVVSKGLESLRSIDEVLTGGDIEDNDGKQAAPELAGRIALDHVTFTHRDATRPALTDLTLTIEAGETVAFVGASGSGKSTLVNLVLGLYRADRGTVCIDGIDVADLDMRTARRQCSVVPQDPVLFDGSVWDNITYGLKDPTEDAVRDALRAANALDFVEALPEGFGTTVGNRGAMLSGGQRQRLAIARAVIRNPRILVLDEATSALDTHSEALVKEALERLRQDRTTLIIAHRITTVRSADRIVVLSHGRITEIGSHDELLAADGDYARLYARMPK